MILGRIKDMVIRGGENIYPAEIEELLYTHPKILDVQVRAIALKINEGSDIFLTPSPHNSIS